VDVGVKEAVGDGVAVVSVAAGGVGVGKGETCGQLCIVVQTAHIAPPVTKMRAVSRPMIIRRWVDVRSRYQRTPEPPAALG
jgi:hypothetical protein